MNSSGMAITASALALVAGGCVDRVPNTLSAPNRAQPAAQINLVQNSPTQANSVQPNTVQAKPAQANAVQANAGGASSIAVHAVADQGVATKVQRSQVDWPCFRGPNGSGVSLETNLPEEWSDTKNLIWKTELPGPGASSPVTLGDRIFITSYSGYGIHRESPGNPENLQRHVVCLTRKDGKILWNAKFSSKIPFDGYGDFTNRHGYASSTPAVDETGVYVYFGTWGARAYSLDGDLKWERSCGQQYFNYGSASSPVLFGDLVIINASVEDRALIAFDKRDGREVWRVGALPGFSYSTPLIVKQASGFELVYPLGERPYIGDKAQRSGLAAVDPRTGKKLWECTSLDVSLYPSPVTNEGIIYGLANRLVAIRSGGRGDVTGTHLLWENKENSEVSSPVWYEDHLYWANENGIACCVNAKNGELVYKERLNPPAGQVYASGVIADRKLYYVSRENGTYVLEAGPRFKQLAHNTLASDSSIFNGSPAISRQQLLMRSDKHLYCLGVK